MLRMTSYGLILLSSVVLLAVPARAQTSSNAQSHLDQANALLMNVKTSTQTDAGKKIAMLQRDFTDFATAYTTQPTADWRTKYANDERFAVEWDADGMPSIIYDEDGE